MSRFTYFLFLICLSSPIGQLFSQQNPCLCIETEQKPCSTAGSRASIKFEKSGSRTISYSVSSDPLPAVDALDNFPGARYKAFWIFGDGNFAYFPHGYPESDAATLTQNYTYRRNGNYKVEALLTEKKSNTKPPARTVRDVEIKNASPGTGTPYARQLSGNVKTADILPSDSMRPHNYLTAFAVSAPRDPLVSGVYFFFNGKVDGANVVATEMHEMVAVDLPDYAGNQYTLGNTLDLRNGLGNQLNAQFKNFIFVPITKGNISAMPGDADFSEYRIFPVLKTILRDGLPGCVFLAVVVGGTPASVNADEKSVGINKDAAGSSLGGFFTPSKMTELNRLTIRYFDGLGLSTPLYYDSTQTPVYVRGIFETRVPMIGSSDPNELEVLSICPTGGGKYKVEMRLQVCNRGMLPEAYVPVRVIDHTAGEFSDFQFLTDKAKLDTTLRFDAASHTWRFVWHDGLEAVYVPADARPGEQPQEVPYSPKCMEVRFSIITTLLGAQKLANGEGLETCATFPSAQALGIPDECHLNFALPAGQFNPIQGFACGVPAASCDCGLLCMLLILVLMAILIWWLRGKGY